MLITKIYYSSNFAKKASKLSGNLVKEISKREALFRKDPFSPVLKTHKLKGKLKDLWSFSITYKHRILFETLKENEYLFHDIGGHEIYG